jgi:predicted O-methyltransferase YrrM
MNELLSKLLFELECFGRENDASGVDRSQRMLNITHDTGEFLAVLINAVNAKNILEIGTSNGYSTLWLASAAKTISGIVTTVEYSPFKIELAAQNFKKSGLEQFIRQIQDDARHTLAGFEDLTFDLIFLDSERSEYLKWWPDIKRTLRPGGLLIVDNATSYAAEMDVFLSCVRQDHEFVTALVPVGNGEFLATKT